MTDSFLAPADVETITGYKMYSSQRRQLDRQGIPYVIARSGRRIRLRAPDD